MTKKLVGRCIGGPYDGLDMAHWSKELIVYRPMIEPFVKNPAIEVVESGRYKFLFGQWRWIPLNSI